MLLDFQRYGQDRATRQIKDAAAAPVHSYIFSGPPAFPTFIADAPQLLLRAAACEFAATLFEKYGAEHAQMARAGAHINLRFIKPEGRFFRVEDAAAVIQEISITPRSMGSDLPAQKIVVCEQFHTAEESVSTRLLKVIEEPPTFATLVLLTEDTLPQTIVSRCAKIDFLPVPKPQVLSYLEDLGVASEEAELMAEVAAGDLGRAHFLLESHNRRFEVWNPLPEALDNTGASITKQVKTIKEFLDESVEGLEAQSEESLKRENRRIRDLEIKFGIFILQQHFHKQLLGYGGTSDSDIAQKLKTLSQAAAQLDRNPNENIFLANLFFQLAA